MFVFVQFDIELAKQNADKPEENEELKKKLWLKIGFFSLPNKCLCLPRRSVVPVFCSIFLYEFDSSVDSSVLCLFVISVVFVLILRRRV